LFTQYYNRARKLLKDKTIAKNDPSLVLYMDMETTTTSWALTVLKDLSQYWNNWTCYNSGSVVDCLSWVWPKSVSWYKNRWNAMYFDWQDYVSVLTSVWTKLNMDYPTNDLTLYWYAKMKGVVNDWIGCEFIDSDTIISAYRYNLFNAYWSFPVFYNWWVVNVNAGSNNVSLDNQWRSILFTKKWKIVSFYINGILVKKKDYWILYTWWYGLTNLYIWATYHCSWWWNPTYSIWTINELRIYNRALSDVEAMELYNSNK